jgi:hypothetical protein
MYTDFDHSGHLIRLNYGEKGLDNPNCCSGSQANVLTKEDEMEVHQT